MRCASLGYGLVVIANLLGCGDSTGEGPSPVDAQTFGTGTYQVTWGPYTAQPGEESTKCVELKLGNTESIHVNEIYNDLGQSSHHLIVYRKAPGPEQTTPYDCFPFAGTLDPANGAPLMVTQRSTETLTLPEGVSFTLAPEQLIRLEMHFVNATDEPVVIQATSEFRTTLDATVEADFLFAGNPDISLSGSLPTTTQTVGPVYLPFPTSLAGSNVFAITGHTHKMGTHVEVAVTPNDTDPGQTVYAPENFSWDEPETVFHQPAFQIPADGGFRFSCDYLNTSGHNISFGEDSTDEMCFFWLYYYPSQGAKVCLHTDQQGGHDVCCPAENGSDDSVICALIQNGLP